jgi:hypothetical protein
MVTKYQKRILGPLLDRIGIHTKSSVWITKNSAANSSAVTLTCALPRFRSFAGYRSEFDVGGHIVLCMSQLNLSAWHIIAREA